MTPELLAPAGSVEALRAAYAAGADAVYIGGGKYGARAYADNPDDGQLLSCIELAHRLDRKLYLTVNTLIKEREIEDMVSWLAPFYYAGLDAAIVQDLGTLVTLKQRWPDLPVHISTQAAVTGAEAAALMEKAGAARVIPARELTLDEIRAIRERTGLEIECFVHGALCYSYSGRCLASSLIGGRSGNRGRCAGICRLPFLDTYPLNMKDLCAVDLLPAMLAAGAESFKIEGRMKRAAYTSEVVRIYRKYLDLAMSDPASYRVEEGDRERLLALFNRDGFTEGYFHKHNGRDMIAIENRKETESRSRQAQEIYAEVDARIASPEQKRLLQKETDGRLYARAGEALRLELCCEIRGEKIRAEVSGDLAERAQKAPVCAERLRELISQTGEENYRFRDLAIDAGEDIFLPVGRVKALRREGFAKLDEAARALFRREQRVLSDETNRKPAASALRHTGAPALLVCVETEEQARVALSAPEAAGVYVPIRLLAGNIGEDLAGIAKGGTKIFAALPRVARGADSDRLREMIRAVRDAGQSGKSATLFLARDLQGLALLLDEVGAERIVADADLYTWNRAARDFLSPLTVRATAPLELNARELGERGLAGDELVVYGRAPMMVSAQCARKTLRGCDAANAVFSLTDRKGKRFPVVCSCDFCYNTIYNSVPTDLSGDIAEVSALGPAFLRVDLTTEDARQSREVITRVAQALRTGRSDGLPDAFTRGHFRRGAE